MPRPGPVLGSLAPALPRPPLAVLLLATASPCQIFTENAGVASPELPALREALRYLQTEEVRELRLDSQLVYSFSTSLESRLTVPAIWRDAGFQTPAAASGQADLLGFGDVSLRGKYSLWQDDDVLESTRWAALAEAVLPTGEHDATEDGVAVPRKLQLGTGGFGGGAGTAFTMIRDRDRFSAEVFYRHTTAHDGFEPGDSLTVNLAYWRRLSPARFPADHQESPLEVRGVVELLTTRRFESHAAMGLHDSGLEIWLAPGIQLFGGAGVLLEAALLFPIYQDIDDAYGRREWGATLALKVLF